MTDKMKTRLVFPDKDEMFKSITHDPETFIETLNLNPKIFEWFDWYLKDANEQRKYIKVSEKIIKNIESYAEKEKVPAAVLFGIAMILLDTALTSREEAKKYLKEK